MLPNKEETYTTALAAAEQTRRQRQEESFAVTWDAAALATAAHALALYIGPLAKVLVQRAAKRAATTEELYATLADMIPVDAERETFLASAPGAATPQAHGPATAPDPEPAEAARPAHARNEAGSAPDKGSWDPAVLKTVEQGLAVYMGPLSGLLVKKAARKCATKEELSGGRAGHGRRAKRIP
jgi:serine/threonine-protein kinase